MAPELALADWLEELAVFGTPRRFQDAETAHHLSKAIKHFVSGQPGDQVTRLSLHCAFGTILAFLRQCFISALLLPLNDGGLARDGQAPRAAQRDPDAGTHLWH